MEHQETRPAEHHGTEGETLPLPSAGDLPDTATGSGDEEINRKRKRPKTRDYFEQDVPVSEWPPLEEQGTASITNTPGNFGAPPFVPNTGGKLPPPKHIVVYRVICDRRNNAEEDHSQHEDTAYYQDEPRLFYRDTRGSALRGRYQIQDLEAYLGNQQPLAFVVYKDYDCPRYHDLMQKQFINIAPENMRRASFLREKPWFQALRDDTEPASAVAEQISIYQDNLTVALESLISQDAEISGFWNRETSLREPYDYFYHCHKRIRELLSTVAEPSDTTSPSITLLLDYIESECRDQWSAADRIFEQGNVTEDTLSKLFRPGEIIIRDEDGMTQAYIADHVGTVTSSRTAISCWKLAFDGAFHRENDQILVEWRGGGKDTLALQCLEARPLRLDKTRQQVQLEQRAIKFWQCRHRRLVSYDGLHGSNFPVPTEGTHKFMIDVDTHRTLYPRKYPEHPSNEHAEIDLSEDEPPSGNIGFLMPAKVPGFGFHDKKWRSLQVDHIRPVDWNENAFKRVVLKASKKELIEALVTGHLENNEATDVIEGKGTGLSMLFHGPPGSGKTLTAETIAEMSKKPLYRLSCGDIGTDPESVGKNLESALHLGMKWDCVVLLDEADVFLEERTPTDMARNALVSAFLRVLEYFKGILLLTSNRVGVFDEAFKSRIQLAIRFPNPDEEGRAKIWDNFFKALQKSGVEMDSEDLGDNVRSLACKELNGRQIRNIIKTARQLAAFRKQRLGVQHLECCIEVLEEFDRYLEDTRGTDD
ncbi:hypothetical protein HRR78_007803 [Exophiala dermatitidis]|nr:hypothetical protein HRR75_007679 [Exophiala dermatitidis]KAJ4539323.1 hypothetical protein HRR78_007803 [Exophiala dermatitidis]